MDVVAAANSVTFGPWRYDRRTGRLVREDTEGRWLPVSLGSRGADILAVLTREPGAVVSKDDLMDAVWPGVAVEPNNLTVQIAALRRVLDAGAAGPSCIQTVPGRGYRLVCEIGDTGHPPAVTEPAPQIAPEPAPPDAPVLASPARSRAWSRVPARVAALGAALLVALAAAGYALWQAHPPELPRMSVVVLPFENLGSPDDEKLAESLTEDLKTSLPITTSLHLMNGSAPRKLDDRQTPPATISRQLGARYAIVGTERRLADTLRVNVQIVAAETASVLWTDRFDVANTASGQEDAVARLDDGIARALIQVEAARSKAERPDNPDALDLHLRARALYLLVPTPERAMEIEKLDEAALRLRPSFNPYRLWLVSSILNAEDLSQHGRKAAFERSSSLLAEAEADAPGDWTVLVLKLDWLYWQENRRCPEVVDLAEHFLLRFNIHSARGDILRWLAGCQIVLGQSEKAIATMDHALTLAPGSRRSHDYRALQNALLMLGRYDESIQAGERALAQNPNDNNFQRARLYRRVAAATALLGRLDEARRKLADGLQIDPFVTLRSLRLIENASPVFVSQLARANEGLKLAGLRDHADEAADFGVPSDNRLHQEAKGLTPIDAPGAATIGTDALVHLLADRHPIVIDALNNFAGLSIPGAVGLRYAGDGGTLTDMAQDRLRAAMRDLTEGDLDAPLVSVGWNSESFDGRDLTLRLVALGYTHVWWYRGGREAWEVRGLPEANLTPVDW